MDRKCVLLKLFILTACFYVCVLSVEASESPNRCDTNRKLIRPGRCVSCRKNMRLKCPSNTVKLTSGRGKRGCRYKVPVSSFTKWARGCSHSCALLIFEKKCCTGYWGQDCQACPSGYSGHVCSGRGTCSEGLTGNGTCLCRGQVSGSACESCRYESQYGPNCEQVCSCVHGHCDSGVDRPGTCSCESGFGGAVCDVVLAECVTLGCHENSRCIQFNNSVVCRCNFGYHGNGTWCEEIDPCTEGANLCTENSSCVKTGPAKYTCICKTGYEGDGKWCGPIDPCQKNNGGCPSNTTFCQYVSPGQAKCVCKPGYDNTSNGCLLINICGMYPNTTCDSTANCTTVDTSGVIQVQCMCPPGTITKDLNCYSDLLSELTFANATGPFENKLNFAISMFDRTYFTELFFSANMFTLLVPQDSAFGSEILPGLKALDNIKNKSAPQFVKWKAWARAHVVPTPIVIDFTEQSATSMYSLLGYNYSIKALKPIGPDPDPDNDDSGIFAAMTYGPSRQSGSILTSAKWATNGVFYVVDTFMMPQLFDIPNFDASNLTLIQALNALPMATSFYKFERLSMAITTNINLAKKNTGISNTEYYYSVLVATDTAFSALSTDQLKYLNSPLGKVKRDGMLLGHVVKTPNKPLNAFTIASSMKLMTMFLEEISVNVSESSGFITVGKARAKIYVTDIPVQGSINIYLIDQILFPTSILPLVSNQCQESQIIEVTGPCGQCPRSVNLCFNGGNLTQSDSKPQTCAFEVKLPNSERTGLQIGCKYSCQEQRISTICCPGFFGANCNSCPGPIHEACNKHGICSDGLNGLGGCDCFLGFQSDDCSVCTNNSTYGANCDQACTCLHGVCANTVSSRGICKPGTCEANWAGENCDRVLSRCGTPSIACHQHATCVLSESYESCVCDPGYIGTGLDCVEFNPCSDGELMCDINAYCSYYGLGNYTCNCNTGFEGNGKQCKAINLCDNQDRGGCHANAVCQFVGPAKRDCKCNAGYRGGGFQCTGIQTCLENNGGCHLHARCVQQEAGQNTCECLDGYSGNGYQCVGPLILEVAEYTDLSFIKKSADRWQSVRDLFNSIRFQAVTAFFPRNQAWKMLTLDDFHFWYTEDNFPVLLRHHIAKGAFAVADLNVNAVLETLLPLSPIKLNNVTTNVNANLNLLPVNAPTLGLENGKIVEPNLMTFNGIIHVIDTVLLPPRDVVNQYLSLTEAMMNATGTDLAQFSLFLGYLNNTGIIKKLEDSGKPYTIFAVNNNLLVPKSVGSAKSLKYHVIPDKMIRLNYIQSGEHETTLAGSGYQVTLVRRHGEFMINGKQIIQRDVRTRHGIIQGISNLLKVIHNNCGVRMIRILRTGCLPCLTTHATASCPLNTTKLAQLTCSMPILPTSPTVNNRGCRLLCISHYLSPKCCKGFFGSECEPCPGGVDNPCLGLGKCSDGLTGNGTCSCNDVRHTGPACDQCTTGYYGDVCDNKCDCVNGTCIDGIQGSGACVCEQGYRGVKCDQVKSATGDSCGGRCHSTSDCVAGQCVCAQGYTGPGENCTAINPCKDKTDSCNAFATCRYRSPGRFECICKNGYQGDGIFCSEVNPCLAANFSGCNDDANCYHTGPNMSNCICKTGFTGDGKNCDSIDACQLNNGGCHIFATCLSTGPGTRDCSCFSDYFGDGITFCTGNMYVELSGNSTFSWFLDSPLMRRVLSAKGPMTAFIPSISTKNANKAKSDFPYFYLNHVVVCASLTVQDLQGQTEVYSSIGKPINITNTPQSVLFNESISIVESRIMSNGIVHFINGTLPYNGYDFPTSNEIPELETFSQLLNFTGLTKHLLLRVFIKWTMLLPTSSSFRRLSVYKQRLLTTDKEYALELNKYHIIDHSFLLPTDLVNVGTFTTLQGSDVDVRCSEKKIGQIVFGAGEVFMTSILIEHSPKTGILAATYILDGVLEPPSIGGRCDIRNNVTIEGTCSVCVNSAMQCPTGMVLIGRRDATCMSKIATPHGNIRADKPISGCVPICYKGDITPKCCDDYFGKDCHACPGGVDNACYQNGECNDGVNGTGQCTCNTGFRGFACELCEQGRFGYDCSICTCSRNGRCADGIKGDGSCFCDQGWTGINCDKKLAHPSNCTNCVENAVCVEGGVCECMPGYLGAGNHECNLPDLCNEQPNGGCSRHASCRQNILQVICTCLNPYSGDGYVCEGNNPCNSDNSATACHEFARCIYIGAEVTRCSCLPGYTGDGKYRCDPDSDQTRLEAKRCAVENGGCSEDASCVDLPPSSTAQNLPNVQCTCKKAFVGNGLVCNGNILQALSQEQYNTGKFYQKIIRKRFFFKLQKAKNITLFVPADQFLVYRKLKYKMLSRLTVNGKSYLSSDLRNMSALLVDSRDAFPVQTLSDGSIYVNGVKILTKDIIATNGVIHVMKGIIPSEIAPLIPVATTPKQVSTSTKIKTTTRLQPISVTPKFKTTFSWAPFQTYPVGNTTSPIVDGGGLSPPKKTVTPKTKRPNRSGAGAKVGIAVAIMFLVVIVIGLLYWKKRSTMFVFRPLSERPRMSPEFDQIGEEDNFSFSVGMGNPAYDSTGFNEPESSDDILLKSHENTGLPETQNDELNLLGGFDELE